MVSWVNVHLEFKCLNSVLNVKVVVGAFNQEKALVGAFSVIVKTGFETDGALHYYTALDLTLTLTISPLQIMALYKDIIDMRAAKNPDYRNGLLSLESKRNYSVREQSLVSDIHGLEANIQALLARKNHLGGLWMPQVGRNAQ